MINIRDSGFYDPLRDARTAAWLERAYVVESQLDGKRASRPVGRPTGATDSRDARIESALAAVLAYGGACRVYSTGPEVTRAYVACVREVEGLTACMQQLDQK